MTTANTVMLPFAIDPEDAYGRLLSHPRVRKVVVKTIRKYRLPPAEAEDMVAKVFEALWRRRNDADPPSNLPRLIALARTVIQGKLTDYFRHKDVERARLVDAPRSPQDDGAEEIDRRDQPTYVEEIAPHNTLATGDALETKEQLAFVQAKVEEGVLTRDDIEVMAAHSRGRTVEELAEERGIAPGTLRVRIHRLRKRLLKAWAEYSLVTRTSTLVLLLLMLLVVVTIVVAALRRKEPPPAPQPPPAPTETKLQPAPRAPILEAPSEPGSKFDKGAH